MLLLRIHMVIKNCFNVTFLHILIAKILDFRDITSNFLKQMSYFQKQISMTNKIPTERKGKITQLNSVNFQSEYAIAFSVILALFTVFLVLSSLHIYCQFSNLEKSISLLLSFFKLTKKVQLNRQKKKIHKKNKTKINFKKTI